MKGFDLVSLTQDRDYADVEEVVKAIKEGLPSNEILTLVGILSHAKYSSGNGNAKGHELRKKYRFWLLVNAKKRAGVKWI